MLELDSTGERSRICESQRAYGAAAHWLTIASGLIALVSPALILLYPRSCLLNPNRLFGAVFEGKGPDEIWAAAGVDFQAGDFWSLFWNNLSAPDGPALFGIVLGCSVALWAFAPAVWDFWRRKEHFYVGVSVFVMALIALSMLGA